MKKPTDHSPDNSDTRRRRRPAVKATRQRKSKPKRSVIHVVPDSPPGGWLVRAVKVFDAQGNRLEGFLSRPGAGLIGAYFAAYQCPTKAEAIHLARTEARLHEPSSVVIHGKNGKFQEERSYGTDPRRTKG
jgi:hypothetical protein